jgi:hypothetical protein
VIDAVRKFVYSRIDEVTMKLERDGQAAAYVHRMFIDAKIIKRFFENSIIEMANMEKNGHTLNEQRLVGAINAMWPKVYNKANIVKAFTTAGISGQTIGKIVYDTQQSTASRHVIMYYDGAYGAKRQVQTGKNKGTWQPKTNYAMRILWGQGIAELEKQMKGIPGSAYGVKGQRNHGDTEGKMSDEQTTVAKMSVGKNFDDEMKSIQDDLFEKAGSNIPQQQMVTHVMKHYKDAFNREYQIQDVQDMSDKGLNRDIIIDITYGSAADNKDKRAIKSDVQGFRAFMAKERRKIIKAMSSSMKKDPKAWLALKGSPSILDRAEDIVPHMMIDRLFKHNTKPDMRFTVNKRLAKLARKAKSTKGTSQAIKRQAKKAGMSTMYVAKTASKKKQNKQQARGQGKTAQSPIALRNLLNELLPQMVASKMTSPALQFRTGRFANSARVENVNIGPRGGMHIDYTYMKAPYETFEPGGKQGSTQRDPRKIIGASLRELAQGIIGRQPSSIRRN